MANLTFAKLKQQTGLSISDLALITNSSIRCIGMYISGESAVPFRVTKTMQAYIAYKK